MNKWLLTTPGYPDTEFEGTPEDAFDALLNEIIGYVDAPDTPNGVVYTVPTLGLLRELKEKGDTMYTFSNGDSIRVQRVD